MSGPKIVRIVTREEVIATCQSELARLDAAATAWQEACERGGLAGAEEIAEMEQRRQEIHALLQRDAFLDLQKQAPREVEFLNNDIGQRRARAAEMKVARRTARRRLAGTAATLLASLAKGGIDVPAELAEALSAVRSGMGSDSAATESTIAQGFALLVPTSEDSAIGERQRDIARQLGDGEETETLAGWLAGHQAADDARGLEIDRDIAVLEASEGDAATRPFAERAAKIAAEPSPQRRKLLADSLILDLVAYAKANREREAALSELAGLAGDLAQFEERFSALTQRAEQARQSYDLDKAKRLIPEMRAARDEARAEQASIARRSAVLGALSRLGYEVREGMATAWADQGSVVLRSAARPGFGVKLSGGSAGGPVQFRATRFASAGAGRNASQDRDAELLWCGDLDALKTHFAETGGEITVEKAEPAGKFPLVTVDNAAPDKRREPAARQPAARRLK